MHSPECGARCSRKPTEGEKAEAVDSDGPFRIVWACRAYLPTWKRKKKNEGADPLSRPSARASSSATFPIHTPFISLCVAHHIVVGGRISRV